MSAAVKWVSFSLSICVISLSLLAYGMTGPMPNATDDEDVPIISALHALSFAAGFAKGANYHSAVIIFPAARFSHTWSWSVLMMVLSVALWCTLAGIITVRGPPRFQHGFAS